MKRLEMSRKTYENIVIPEEFTEKVEDTIRKARQQRQRDHLRGRRRRTCQWAAGIAAAFVAVVMVGLNTSGVFAREAQKLPVIGELAKILTIRSYEKEEGDTQIRAEIPAVELGGEGQVFSEEINAQIEKVTAQYETEAVQRAEEYKKAFLETGGTEEEWAEHDIRIQVWYEIKSQTEDTLSFIVKGTESWTSAYAETRYYNLDLQSNAFLSLEDLLGTDYQAIADEAINAQIEERTKAGDVFFSAEEGGFTGIGENPGFYINEKGNPVIVFEEYAIAPGFMGEVEFEIQR